MPNTEEASPAPAPVPVKLLLTIPEAAASLSLGRSFLYELVQCGDIRTIKIGRSRRVPVSVLQEYVARQLQAQSA